MRQERRRRTGEMERDRRMYYNSKIPTACLCAFIAGDDFMLEKGRGRGFGERLLEGCGRAL